MRVSDIQVSYVNHMGNDLAVVNAARVSFNKESKYLSEKDTKLINYLAKHNHFTPFTHCIVSLNIKVPIFVARQLHKHQVGFTVNEVSRRYVTDEPEFYMPKQWRKAAENVKQGSSDEILNGRDLGNGIFWTPGKEVLEVVRESFGIYKVLLEEGVCPEQARMILPQNTMTEFWMTGSLYAWARLCKLRLDSHTQKETQEVAKLINEQMIKLYPVSWEALMKETK